jgi:hypothetical protein
MGHHLSGYTEIALATLVKVGADSTVGELESIRNGGETHARPPQLGSSKG